MYVFIPSSLIWFMMGVICTIIVLSIIGYATKDIE